eukprot:COSAG01_NODE_18455_length_1074_cov_14.540513_1_plen_151_part_10
MRRSQRLRGARQHAGRRCQGCKDAHCVRPVLTHWEVLVGGDVQLVSCPVAIARHAVYEVAHHLEFDAGILCAELQRIPTLCSSVVKTLAARGVCTMTSAAKRNGVSFAHNGHYCSLSLPNAFNKFVTWSHWNEDAHHDAAYDVRKTLELYD